MTTNPYKVIITFEDPRDGNLFMVPLAEVLNGNIPINIDGIAMEFVEANIV